MAFRHGLASALKSLLAGGLALLALVQSAAAVDTTVTQGNIAPIPIAVPEFVSEDPKLALDVADVVANDLASSGLFQPLNRAAFLERIRDINVAPNFANWRAVRADALVAGRVGRGADGRIAAEFRLWDTINGQQKAAQRFGIASKLGQRAAWPPLAINAGRRGNRECRDGGHVTRRFPRSGT